MRQISEPDRTRSLPNRHLNLGHEDVVVKAPVNFGRGGRFEEQGERFDEVGSRLFDGRTLARNVELRAQSYEAITLTFDDRDYALRWLHSSEFTPAPLNEGLASHGREG